MSEQASISIRHRLAERRPQAVVCLGVGLGIGLLALACLAGRPVSADEIGYVETFALASDRAAVLSQLAPGTDDYYYYHALQALQSEQYEKVEQLLIAWRQRNPVNARARQIEHRLRLATYDRTPDKTIAYLRAHLQLPLNHQRQQPGLAPNVPTALSQADISRDALLKKTLAQLDHLNDLEPSAWNWLAPASLPPLQRRVFLQQLKRPDAPGLVDAVVADLATEPRPNLGDYAIHYQLLLKQLDELAAKRPELRNQLAFVNAYLPRLQPGPDEDWRHNAPLRDAYLRRLQTFTDSLAPVHKSLQAHVLYHRLQHDRQQGRRNKALLLRYLAIPRTTTYASQRLLESAPQSSLRADLNSDFASLTLLAPIGDDEPLVRDYLAHFLADAADAREFAPFVNEAYLRRLLAETKIVHGLGAPEQWASQLPVETYRAIQQRVDLDFASDLQANFAVGEPVVLELFVKNAPQLIVKIFELNAVNHYRLHKKAIDADIQLDGLVANHEFVFRYDDPPHRRIKRRFELPQLSNAGVYVVDFIGNGKSSRALIRKGALRHVVRTTAAGPMLQVYDERDQLQKDAAAWLEGHEYRADAEGRITLPFSGLPGPRALVLSAGPRASLESFEQEGESYSLQAGIHVDREALLSERTATLFIRAGLYLNGTLVSPQLLENVRLEILATNRDGVTSFQQIEGLALAMDRELTQEFRTPPRLASLQVTLRGQVKSLLTSQLLELSASQSFAVNSIDATERTEDLHLVKLGGEWQLELRGKSGEPRPLRAVTVQVKHRDFKSPVHAALKTDEQGRTALGALVDIESITATGPQGLPRTWRLAVDEQQVASLLHLAAGDVLRLPYSTATGPEGAGQGPSREDVSLLELRGEQFVADHFERLAVEQKQLVIQGLPAGDYDLWLKREDRHVRIRVIPGLVLDRFLIGTLRAGELPRSTAPQITEIAQRDDAVVVKVANASAGARVHVFVSRFEPAFAPFQSFSRVVERQPRAFLAGSSESLFVTGRNIGDEYRYILDRRLAPKFPGNSLERPSLLLNPWARQSTQTGSQIAEFGDSFQAQQELKAAEELAGALGGEGDAGHSDGANLDFLAASSLALANLVPDKDGVVRIPQALIGPRHRFQVVVVDAAHVVVRHATLNEQALHLLDLRLAKGFDPQRHFAPQRRITVLDAGQSLVVTDMTSSRVELYDSVAGIHRLYAAISKNPQWNEFSFLAQWPTLPLERRRELYSKYACHELHLFLWRKDPQFFATVVRPFLGNKKDKTFVDRCLIDADLAAYSEPWTYGRLNALEQLLLGRRQAAERPRVERRLRDQFELLPVDVNRAWRLFETAVQGNVLQSDATEAPREALAAVKDSVEESRRDANSVRLREQLSLAKGRVVEDDALPAINGPARAERAAEGANDGSKSQTSWHYRNRGANGRWDEDALGEVEARFLKREMPQRSSIETRAYNVQLGMEAVETQQKGFDGLDLALTLELKKRVQLGRSLYRNVEPTMEYAESNYFRTPIEEQKADLISVNAFWHDLSTTAADRPLRTRHLAEPTHGLSEMLAAIALFDLPFQAGKHELKTEGAKLTLVAASPLAVYHEEILPAELAAGPATVLASQHLYRRDDRQQIEAGETVDKYVTGELLTHVVYGCQVVVANPTSRKQRLTVLTQIPVGSIAVSNSQATRAVPLELAPYQTQTLEYEFYFPAKGDYAHFPVHVARGEQLAAFAPATSLHVVDVPTQVDSHSWAHVSQNASAEEVLAFLRAANLARLDLTQIAFRLRDKDFFVRVLELLRERHVYDATLWTYGFLHGERQAISEFLQHHEPFVAECGGYVATTLLNIDPVDRHAYQHLEYKPLINARAHALAGTRRIVNDRFREQYLALLAQLAFRARLSDDDRLVATYYLLLQDRVAEALAAFVEVDRQRVASPLQYDYMAAYLDFFRDEPRRARELAQAYVDHPVDHWRNAFRAIVAQVDEIEGKGPAVVDPTDRNQQQAAQAASAPNLELKVEGRRVEVVHQNVRQFVVNFYSMDIELLFSRQPFLRESAGQFASIRPNATLTVDVEPEKRTSTIEIPETLRQRNVLVEVVGGGVTRSQAVFATSFQVQLLENYGQLRATDAATKKPLSKAYVKVYARHADGSVRFYKDGYTDIRGRFEYASLSTADLQSATRFAILVLGDHDSAVVREADPPAQ